MLSTLCEPNKICLWARFGLWFTSLQDCLSKEVRSVLVLLPFLFFLTTFFFQFLEFPEADGLDWPVLFSWGNSLFLTMVVTPDPGARGHVSYVIWMVEMIKSACVYILERPMVRVGGDFPDEFKTRTVNHGYFTKLENPSFEVLGNGNKILKWTINGSVASYLPWFIYLLYEIFHSLMSISAPCVETTTCFKVGIQRNKSYKQWDHVTYILSVQATQIQLCEWALLLLPSMLQTRLWSLLLQKGGNHSQIQKELKRT